MIISEQSLNAYCRNKHLLAIIFAPAKWFAKVIGSALKRPGGFCWRTKIIIETVLNNVHRVDIVLPGVETIRNELEIINNIVPIVIDAVNRDSIFKRFSGSKICLPKIEYFFFVHIAKLNVLRLRTCLLSAVFIVRIIRGMAFDAFLNVVEFVNEAKAQFGIRKNQSIPHDPSSWHTVFNAETVVYGVLRPVQLVSNVAKRFSLIPVQVVEKFLFMVHGNLLRRVLRVYTITENKVREGAKS